jgi:hypothetical protein
VPIIGQDIFLNLTAKNFTLFEYRKLPVPSGVSAAQANSSEFFGRGQQQFLSNDTSFALDLFKGETAFKPVTWLLRVNAVYNNNWLRVKENNLVDPTRAGRASTTTSASRIRRPFRRSRQKPPTSTRAPAIPAASAPLSIRRTSSIHRPATQPLGDARPLVKVDPITQEVPEHKEANSQAEQGKQASRPG